MAGTAKTDLAAIMTNDNNSGGNTVGSADVAAAATEGVDIVSMLNTVRSGIEHTAALVYQIQQISGLSGGLTALLSTLATDLT